MPSTVDRWRRGGNVLDVRGFVLIAPLFDHIPFAVVFITTVSVLAYATETAAFFGELAIAVGDVVV